MGFMGCAACLQFVAIISALGSIAFALLAVSRDYRWNIELERIQTQFSVEEVHLLRRNFYWLELGFIGSEFICMIMLCVHSYLCFRKYEHAFHRSRQSKILAYITGILLIAISTLILASAYYYNIRLYKVEAMDKRTYLYKEEELELDGSVHYTSSQSLFHYCHWANGSPRDWSRLKGLRIKKTGTQICQRYGSKILAAVLSIFSGIAILIFSCFLKSHRRDKEAAYVVMLYELFGDYEEAMEEHYGQPFILKEYKESLLKRAQNLESPLTPKMKKLVKGDPVAVNDNEAYLFPEDNPYFNEEDFNVIAELKEDIRNQEDSKPPK